MTGNLARHQQLWLVKLTRIASKRSVIRVIDDPDGLVGTSSGGCFEISRRSFWATYQAVRSIVSNPSVRSSILRHQRGNPQSLDEGVVTAAYGDDRDTLWIGRTWVEPVDRGRTSHSL